MTDNNKNDLEKNKDHIKDGSKNKSEEITVEQKLKETEDKLLRSLAEIENQGEGSKKKLRMRSNSVHITLLRKV